MRERLIVAFVGLAIVIVGLYGVPRAYTVAGQVQAAEGRKIERSVVLVAALVDERLTHGESVDEEFLEARLNVGERLEFSGSEGFPAVEVGDSLVGNGTDIVRTVDLEEGGTITMARSGALVAQRVAESLAPIMFIGLALIFASAFVGFVLARRLSRPFRELAVVASQLGTGRFDVQVREYSVPEARNIAFALQSSASALETLLRREQEFASNASHQLRTPITALRLELEDLSFWPETPSVVQVELGRAIHELDRLSETVTELLDYARGQRLSSVFDLNIMAIVKDAAARWSPAVKAASRTIGIRSSAGEMTAKLPGGPILQILDVLIENSLKHGSGLIVIGTSAASTHLEISVSDQGRRPVDDSIFARTVGSDTGGEGIGLAIARGLAHAIGGHLMLADSPRTSFVLMLPLTAAEQQPEPA